MGNDSSDPCEVIEVQELALEKTRSRRKSYTMDLRVHSPASLGYYGLDGIDTAPALVSLAKVKGLDVIAVTDFYSGRFVDRVVEAARGTEVHVIPGADIRCKVDRCDDVIVSCLFPEQFSGAQVESFLVELGIPKRAFGDRSYLTQASFDVLLALLNKHQGIAIPSRIDKTPYRLTALPMLVEQYGFRAFDLAYKDSSQIFKRRWPKHKFQLFTFSNANSLAQVGSRTAKVKMPFCTFDSIRELVARADK